MKKIALLSLASIFIWACGDDSSAASPEENALAESSSSEAQNTLSSESKDPYPGDILSSAEGWEFSSSSESLISSSSGTEPSGKEPGISSNSDEFSSSSVESSADEQDLSSAAESSSSVEYIDPATVVRDSMVDPRDGQVYRTVTIGNQTWMAENLNYAYLQPTSTLDSSSYCLMNEPDSCAVSGRLYLWSAAMDSVGLFSNNCRDCGYGVLMRDTAAKEDRFIRGVCPEGWHVTTHSEWWNMFRATGVTTEGRGGMVKDPVAWGKTSENAGAYGLDLNPTGVKGWEGRWEHGNYASYWTSTEHSNKGAYSMAILEYGAEFQNMGGYGYSDKDYASAVRCIKNYE